MVHRNNSNLYKSNLRGKKIGVFFGTFAPLHVGHQAEIYKAAALNDGVVVITSGYRGDRGDSIGLPVAKRFRYLREAFNDEPQIKVALLEEDDIPRIPDGWDQWLKRLLDVVIDNIENKDAELTFYTAEEEYKRELEKRFFDKKSYSVSVMDRTIVNISGTEIRENPLKNWDYINRVFRRHFAKKVTLMGPRNTGKSALVRRLARTANSPFSNEFRKIYQEESNVTNTELDARDYINIVNGQFNANSSEITSPANNGLTIFDTDAISIKTQTDLSLDKNDQALLDDLYRTVIAAEEHDLILVLPPEAASKVDSNLEQRQTFYNQLLSNLESYDLMDKVVILDAKGTREDEEGYYQRYLQSLDAVQKYTGFDIKHLEK